MKSCNDEEEACSSGMQSLCNYKNKNNKEEEEEEASSSGMQLPCSSRSNNKEEEASSSGKQLPCSSKNNEEEAGGGGGSGGGGRGRGRRPKGTGRKKIEIKRIEHKLRRKVAFSKRRKGLFKKATEICKLCGAEIAVVVFSPKGKLFSCGHPSVEHVVHRFLEENRNESYTVLQETTEEEKAEDDSEDHGDGGGGEEEGGYWFDGSIEKLEMENLEEFIASLIVLKKSLSTKIDELTVRRTLEIDFLGGFGGS